MVGPCPGVWTVQCSVLGKGEGRVGAQQPCTPSSALLAWGSLAVNQHLPDAQLSLGESCYLLPPPFPPQGGVHVPG